MAKLRYLTGRDRQGAEWAAPTLLDPVMIWNHTTSPEDEDLNQKMDPGTVHATPASVATRSAYHFCKTLLVLRREHRVDLVDTYKMRQ